MMINPATLEPQALRSPAAARLMEEGYVILRGAAPADKIAAIAADFAPRYAATPFCQGGFYGPRTKRFGRLLIRSPLVEGLVLHPGILAIAEAALGPWCERIQLNLAQAIELHPGAPAQFPHRDQDMWRGSLGEVEYLINVMWPLTPFTAENGATIIWPSSHGAEALVEEPREAPVVASADPGDAIVFLGSTLHGAGANASDGARQGIIISYCLGWLKPYENQWLAYPPDIARAFSPELAGLAGYAQHRPNLGNFEGQCPSILFGGYPQEPVAAIDALRPDQEALLAEHIAAQRRAGMEGAAEGEAGGAARGARAA
ncbi:phytanoyl-CoA dioxygenase family protein [Sphingopyxis sp. JAI108]|uniref:phytanoyl-CoA dioxygenase family protein n=1 Tax=Sphingopyxis sp. JAI108 TaxID=2723060 RepID=UPI00181240FB|nr:ectoine hydroxylase-related dioxygenase (phytanoyl-CoA dioxygenase family) [Sphingopyxis sp. JAI108]